MATMGRSQSASSLRAAGSGLMSHIPKRAAQHGIFLDSSEVIPICLKPGQKSLQRQVYSEEARALAEHYNESGKPPSSVYAKSISSLLRPEDYTEPSKPIKPSEAPNGGGHWGTGHWKSEYGANMDHRALHGATHHRQHGPSYQAMNPPMCISAGALASSYHAEFGHHGSDPRDKIGPDDRKLPVFRSALTVGTHKGTMHIPGYQGFLATNTRNPHVARVEMGGNLRSTDKSNLTETFYREVVGYQGHQPTHHSNDNGGMRPSLLTTTGKDFQAPDLQAFA